MTSKLNWKISKDKKVMVGLYREVALYKIEVSDNEEPYEFNDMLMGRVVAYSEPRWTSLRANSGLGDAEGAAKVMAADSPRSSNKVYAGFRMVSAPVSQPKEIEKYMKEYRNLIDIDFAYCCKHIDNIIEPKANSQEGARENNGGKYEKDRIKNFDRRIRQLIKNFGAARVLENYEKQIYSWVEGILPEGTYESLTKLIIICEKWAGQKSPEINFTPNSVEYPYREVCKELTEVVTILTPQLFAKILHKQRDKCAKEDLFYEISDIFSQLQGDSINYIVKRLENKKLRAAKKLTFPELRPKKIQKQLEARLMRALEINYQDEVLPQAYRARDCLIRDEIDNMFCEAQFATRETTEVSALGEVKAAHQKAQQQINRARRAGRGN